MMFVAADVSPLVIQSSRLDVGCYNEFASSGISFGYFKMMSPQNIIVLPRAETSR